ncbi:HNH endonuclease [Pseudomonas fulva]|uniref:HNH endonuclease n=1 Tax=Pseudomonas fulva TaxID=47880 RepID=UPI0034CF3B8D
MKRLTKPTVDAAVVFDACIGDITDLVLANKFIAARADILAVFAEYEENASGNTLFSFPRCRRGDDSQVVIGGLSKGELVSLYTSQLAKKTSNARRFYDQIMLFAPSGKCPFCGCAPAETLDHFMSKSIYPAFSVLSLNLTPACFSCNKGKGFAAINAADQVLHPYYEPDLIDTSVWLYAVLVETVPASVNFSANPPSDWPPDLAIRLSNYFRDFRIAWRFGIEAASEITSQAAYLVEIDSPSERRSHLQRVARVERRERKNSWKAALFEALAQSEWFQNEGCILHSRGRT